jgi:hypothetical protein
MAAINRLELSILIADPYNPNVLKKITHKKFTIDASLEMYQEVDVVCYENNNGQAGLLMLTAIEQNENLTPEQKSVQREIYKTRPFSTSTAGYMVDPLTGQQAIPVDGQYPDGSISELEYWQQMPFGVFTKQTLDQLIPGVEWLVGDKMSELIYNGLLMSAVKIIQRNRI